MTVMAGWLARKGWHLASGGAAGADNAFARGAPAGRRTLYLPWPGYNGHSGPDRRVLTPDELSACMAVAGPLHPAWDRCSDTARKLHARNVAILLSSQLDRPVHAVLCWSPGAAIAGGTGMALRIAAAHGIPVMNLGALSARPRPRRRDIQGSSGCPAAVHGYAISPSDDCSCPVRPASWWVRSTTAAFNRAFSC